MRGIFLVYLGRKILDLLALALRDVLSCSQNLDSKGVARKIFRKKDLCKARDRLGMEYRQRSFTRIGTIAILTILEQEPGRACRTLFGCLRGVYRA